jgi:hypothetical protein
MLGGFLDQSRSVMIGSDPMKLTTSMAAFAVAFMLSQSAQAHTHHHHQQQQRVARHSTASRAYAYAPGQEYGYGSRPAAWCGWEMRQLVSSDPGPEFNLARNWARWGRPGPVGVGAIVVWSHHVGKIVGKEGGMWVIESGNDDHATRTRPRSISGAIAIRWG